MSEPRRSQDAAIDRVWPDPASALDDDALLEHLRFPGGRTWLRANFVSSIDGAATREGLSGGLGDPADRRLFDLQRRGADVVVVGAGTARNEGYSAMRVDAESVAWRVDAGLPPHPIFVLVSRSLDLDPTSEMFTDAPVRPIVYTVGSAPGSRRAALAEVADVVDVGEDDVDPMRMREDLAARGLHRIHAEGGPHLFGAMLVAGAVDALHLTFAPTLEAGDAGRITASAAAAPTAMRLSSVLRAGDELLLHYVRD